MSAEHMSSRRMASGRPRAAAIVVNTLLLWLAVGIASITLWPIYQSSAIVVLIAVTTVVASIIAILGSLFGWSSARVLFATVGAFVVFGVPLAVPQEAAYGVLPTFEGLRQLVAGVALGWKQLLTITLPVGNYQALLVPPFVLLLVLIVTALSLALRSRFGDIGVAAPVIVFIIGVIFGPDYATLPVVVTLTLASTCLFWLMWRRWYARRRAIDQVAHDAATAAGSGSADIVAAPGEHRLFGVRTFVSAVVILAIAGGAATAAAVLVPPEGRRQVLRSSVQQPFDPRDYVSPLAAFRSYLKEPTLDEVLFTIDGLPDGARVRIATLDSYDGIVYSVGSAEVDSASGSFTRVPFRFDQSAVEGDDVSLEVSIVGYSGVWLPTVGKLESVAFTGPRTTQLRDSFFYNDNGSTAAIVGGLESGDGYTLDAVVPFEPSSSQIAGVEPGTASVPALGTLPAELELALSGYVEGVDGQGEHEARDLLVLREQQN